MHERASKKFLMSSLRNKLIALLAWLAVVGSLIDGPLLLPVTGGTTVSGSVAATQSGA
jgi:hypothetical protein